ncbi:Stp1/IreP family PP2C-type Ser/Thr phosphatase [Rhodoferax sp. TBRC 17660]|uniref:Stp1/IreP family PP2C-type Ser/Thr phosphatase n=1 Tax=Rhodoferax potami TaxID=3068338 RepID=A0ABU3KMP8_9BURK|nr:Stp1/IreP family PP2C-type Ser/Thr phosphatase [Rhodoferax sp. TBRC 17660]MDT7519085.1 Stp1/IreP family PP2C-type Ser/Thr phosphatase [Rhodoferax sp. TBRC 17660]
MMYQFHAKTDPGRCRENNEDSVAFDDQALVAVLADGMGGYNAGEIASGMATAFIKAELSRWLSEAGANAQMRDIRRAMEICVDNANIAIYNSANANPSFAGMGTTLVLGVIKDGRLLVGHIGDSRCYRLRQGRMEQITKDHSLLQEQMDAGLITPEQAAGSPIKNLVTRALGVEQGVMLEVNEFSIEPGDVYLMCSDGLSDMVSDEVIVRIAFEDLRLEPLAEHLILAANESGGRDNISVLLVAAGEAVEKKGFIAKLLGK